MQRPNSLPALLNPKGFTLLEVMIAVSIIAIGMVALFGSQSRSLSLATEAHFNNLAPLLASLKLAEIASGSVEMENDDGDFGEDYPGYSWQTEVEDAPTLGIDALADLEEPLQRVRLTVLWSETSYNYSLTYYGRPLE